MKMKIYNISNLMGCSEAMSTYIKKEEISKINSTLQLKELEKNKVRRGRK